MISYTRNIKGHDTTASALVWFLYCMATNLPQQVRDFFVAKIAIKILPS